MRVLPARLDSHHVRVIEERADLRLALELGDELPRQHAGAQPLQRDQPRAFRVLDDREVDVGHSAGAEQRALFPLEGHASHRSARDQKSNVPVSPAGSATRITFERSRAEVTAPSPRALPAVTKKPSSSPAAGE